MSEEKPAPSRWIRLAWLGVYALLCAFDFVVSAAKDFVEERIKGEKKEEDDEGEKK